MKRTRQESVECEPLVKKLKVFQELPSEVVDYVHVKDGLSMLMTSKYYHDNHKDHQLFSAGKLVKNLQQMPDYYASLFLKASTFVCDQIRAKEKKHQDKPKVKSMLKIIRQHFGKQVSKELKEKVFKKLEYLRVDQTDMKREFKIGEYLIIHSCNYTITASYGDQDVTVCYDCKIKSMNGEDKEYELIKACDSEQSKNIGCYLNELFSISANIDPTLIFVCLLVIGPCLTWVSVGKNDFMEVGSSPPSDRNSFLKEQCFVNSLFNHFILGKSN